MKTTLHVNYCTDKYLEGFKFRTFNHEFSGEIYLGDIEIDNPYDIPDLSTINNAKVEAINDEIKEHKAKINLLENQVKDLLSIEHKEVA